MSSVLQKCAPLFNQYKNTLLTVLLCICMHSSDEDFEVDNTKYRSPTAHTNPGKLTKSCQSSSKSKVVKILSSDSESDCYEDKGL